VTNDWIAERLSMGHHGSVSRLVVAASKDAKLESELKKLMKLLKCVTCPLMIGTLNFGTTMHTREDPSKKPSTKQQTHPMTGQIPEQTAKRHEAASCRSLSPYRYSFLVR
jgi:hypothetical protein